MGRLWNRLVNMENDHLTKMFLCEINLFVNITGAMKLYSYFQIMDLRILFLTNCCVNVKIIYNYYYIIYGHLVSHHIKDNF